MDVTRKLFIALFALLVAAVAAAQDVSVRDDHPGEYTVVRGDTLWDISARFLEHPWQWPAIWHVNPQIENPHLIYPGDVVSLRYIDGEPRLMVNDGQRVVRLSPDTRRTDQSAIPPIPLSAIQPFITNTWVADEAEFDAMAYVIQNYEQRINAMQGVNTYVRGISGNVGDEVVVLRPANEYWDVTGRKDAYRHLKRVNPQRFGEFVPLEERTPLYGGEFVAYELWEVARGTLVKQGDPAIIRVDSGRTEVWEGDRVVPAREAVYDDPFLPRAMDSVPEGLEVVALQQNRYGAGHYQIVTINAGARQGIETGHVFSAFRPGEHYHDDVKYPKGTFRAYKDEADVVLPDEFDGHIMVFRVFDDISFAMVMGGNRAVLEHDILKHPSEVL